MAGHRTVRESFEEYGRGIGGGLLVSLPLLFTMEVWWTGFLVEPHSLLLYMLVTLLLLLGYNRYAGIRRDASWLEIFIDSIEEMGIGMLLSAVVLFLIGRITAEMPVMEVIGKTVVTAMTVAVGVSVGTAQLGGGGGDSESSGQDTGMQQGSDSDEPPDARAQLVLGFCGAVLFAANVAPTEEIVVIAAEISSLRLFGLVAASLALGVLIFSFSGFSGADRYVHSDGPFWTAYGLVSSYASALLASALMLWFFRRFDDATLSVAVAEMVVLAFPAMLGASAGRLLIQ